jgi:Xaa-Pro dipeptidase
MIDSDHGKSVNATASLELDGGALLTHNRFSMAEYARRHTALRQLLAENHLAGVVIYGNRGQTSMLHYLANFNPRWEAFLFFPGEGEPVLLVQLYNHLPDAQRVSVVTDTRWGGPDSIQTLGKELQSRGIGAESLGVAGSIPYQRYQALQEALPGITWLDVTGPLARLRWIKSEEEITVIQRAAQLTDLSMAALVQGVRPGMRECDLPGLLQAAVQPAGGQLELCYLATTPMEDPSVFVPRQNLTTRRVRVGDVIITEIGVGWGGYSGQIHRPVAIGRPPTQDYQRLFDVAQEAYYHIAEVIRPGVTVQAVLDAAEIIHDRGFTIYDDLVHGFGGGYLPPVLRTRQTSHNKSDDFVFAKNMCIVIQPNVISLDQRSGIQLGQLHVLRDHGLEPLQHYPFEFSRTHVPETEGAD